MTFTYNPSINSKKLHGFYDDGYVYGIKYVDFINADKDIRMIPIPRSQDLKKYIDTIRCISKKSIKKTPLFKEGKQFKSRSIYMNKEHMPPMPNVPESMWKKYSKILEESLSKLYKKEFKIGSKYEDLIDIVNNKVLYKMIYTSALLQKMSDFIDFLSKIKDGMVLEYIQKVDLTSVSSYCILIFGLV